MGGSSSIILSDDNQDPKRLILHVFSLHVDVRFELLICALQYKWIQRYLVRNKGGGKGMSQGRRNRIKYNEEINWETRVRGLNVEGIRKQGKRGNMYRDNYY